MALLEHEDDQPEGGGEGEQVGEHRFERQHHRADEQEEDHVRHQDHEDHGAGHVGQDQVDEVLVDGGVAGHQQRAPGRVPAGPDPVEE